MPMLIAAEIQRSLTGTGAAPVLAVGWDRQAWSSAERELMPH
jgi:hypothetical protein